MAKLIDLKRFAKFLKRLVSKAAETPGDVSRDLDEVRAIIEVYRQGDPEKRASQCGRLVKRIEWIQNGLTMWAMLGDDF